jgi:autotransporter-associated beta strand protein
MIPAIHRSFPQSLALFAAPLLTLNYASAAALVFNESNTTGVWPVPSGTNILNGATATPVPVTHEGSSNSWTTVTDGFFAGQSPTFEFIRTVTPNNNSTVTFPLDILAQPGGYDVTTFDSWVTWANTGRSNQHYTLQYSTVAAPTTWVPIATVANVDGANPSLSTHTFISDTTGVLATGVHSLRIVTNTQENGYVGFTELKARAVPTNVTTVVEGNSNNLWSLPGGLNLLNGFTAISAPPLSREGSSASWATATDRLLGTPGGNASSVTPGNNFSVVFPLDLFTNSKGYKLSSLDTYSSWGNSGRDNQAIKISYSTVEDPGTFIRLGSAVANSAEPVNSTHVGLTPATGFLARNVGAVRFDFGHEENGYVGYREFIALGQAESVSTALTWTGATASWVAAPDGNWEETVGGAPASFDPLSELTFDATASNFNVAVPGNLNAFSLVFNNTALTPYTFSGQAVELVNGLNVGGSGDVTLNNALLAPSGIKFTGSGNLTFNGAVETPALTVAGPGTLTLNAANPAFGGTATVSAGALVVSNNSALEFATLVANGGITRFLTAAPKVAGISGLTGASVVLGESTGPLSTTLNLGDVTTTGTTIFRGGLSQAAGATGSLTKYGINRQILAGQNTYTGVTNVLGGTLEFATRSSLYDANPAAWTSTNLLAANGGTLSFAANSVNAFTQTELDGLSLGGFQAGSSFGLNTTENFTLTRSLTETGVGLTKTGTTLLTLTGNNTSTGAIRVFEGSVNAANTTGGTSLGGNVVIGNASANAFLSFGASNQFGPDSVLSFQNGLAFESKVNLRGTNQAVAGLDSSPSFNRVPLIQNDEIGQVGYTTPPLAASLTINAATDHSFYGLIRNQAGGVVSLVKNGPGTQEFLNVSTVQGFGYSGPTTINEGALKLNFTGGNSGFASNVAIASGATLQFDGVFNFFRTISGAGQVTKTGAGMISLVNQDGVANANTYSGGTVIEEGILKFFAANASAGNGNAAGQFCVAGPMDPSNIITVKSGATVAIGGIAALGNSPLLPEFAPTINIEPGGRLWGSEGNDIAFVANLNLDGASVEVMNGSTAGNFNTNIALVGMVTVGGDSSNPTTVFTTGIGANANITLGSLGLIGTTFQVSDVTTSAAADLVVSSVLRDVLANPSPLTKTGAGTMQLVGAKSYTGTTSVTGGVLQLDSVFLADGADVLIDTTGTLELQHEATDTIGRLVLDGVIMDAGTYGSTSNTTPGIVPTARITGSGLLEVTVGPEVTFGMWAEVIPLEEDRERTDDPDGDGFTNLEEFLFGTSPVEATGTLTSTESTPEGLIIRWNQRSAGDSVYVLQESTTLVDMPWQASSAVITDDAVQGLTDYVRKQALIPYSGVRNFVRVDATE